MILSYGVPLGELYTMKEGKPTGRKRIQEFALAKWFFEEELYRPKNDGFVFFVHTKFLLIDPHSDDPLVCSGSANFSPPSLTANDENMLLIRGDKRVADIYMSEFDRIFRHFYFRDIANELSGKGDDEDAIFLNEKDEWTTPYFKPKHVKNNRRLMFFAPAGPTWADNAVKGDEGSRKPATKTKGPAKKSTAKRKTPAKKKKRTPKKIATAGKKTRRKDQAKNRPSKQKPTRKRIRKRRI